MRSLELLIKNNEFEQIPFKLLFTTKNVTRLTKKENGERGLRGIENGRGKKVANERIGESAKVKNRKSYKNSN